MGHFSAEPITNLVRNSGRNWWGITTDIERLVNACKVCSLHKRKPNRKSSCIPCASTFNEVVALDLKDYCDGTGRFILYCVCEFSCLIRGVVLKDKTAVNGIFSYWIFGGDQGPGPTSSHFHTNRGLEFVNRELLALCEAHGIRLESTATYSL